MSKLNKSSLIDDSSETGTELVEISGLELIQRAEIDVQVSTAKRWPRQIDQFKKRAIALATLDDETAESCLYRRPVGRENGKQVFAEGMSIRMAEIVGASYGNLRVAATIIEQTERKVVARGMAFDMESNFASSSEVVESTVTKDGLPFSERMRIVIAKAALAKARRDATFQVVPRAIAKPVEQAVRQLLMGNSESLGKRRDRALSWIAKLDIGVERVFAALGVKGPSDLTADELEKLTGLKTAIKDGEVSVDEAFPELAPKMRTAAGVKENLEASDAKRGDNPQAGPISPTTAKGPEASTLGDGKTLRTGEVIQSSGQAQRTDTANSLSAGEPGQDVIPRSSPPSPSALPGEISKPKEQPVAIPTAADAPGELPGPRRRKALAPQAEMPLQDPPTPQKLLEAGCEKHGIGFDRFRQYLIDAGFEEAGGVQNVESMATFAELPDKFCRGLLRSGELLYAEVLK